MNRDSTAQREAPGVQISAPTIREGRDTVSSIASPGAITSALQYEATSKQLASLLNNPPTYPEQQAAYHQTIATLRGQIASLTTGAPDGTFLVGTKGEEPVCLDQPWNFHVNE